MKIHLKHKKDIIIIITLLNLLAYGVNATTWPVIGILIMVAFIMALGYFDL